MTQTTIALDIAIDTGTDRNWHENVVLTIDLWPGMDETDVNIEIAEAVGLWCSNNGYTYDDDCEYLEGYDEAIDRILGLANPVEHATYADNPYWRR